MYRIGRDYREYVLRPNNKGGALLDQRKQINLNSSKYILQQGLLRVLPTFFLLRHYFMHKEIFHFIGLERHSDFCVSVEKGSSEENCTNTYLDQVTLSFESTVQNCSDSYQAANEMFSSACNESNVTDNCKVNIYEIMSEYPGCFQSNTLRVDYSCEGKWGFFWRGGGGFAKQENTLIIEYIKYLIN